MVLPTQVRRAMHLVPHVPLSPPLWYRPRLSLITPRLPSNLSSTSLPPSLTLPRPSLISFSASSSPYLPSFSQVPVGKKTPLPASGPVLSHIVEVTGPVAIWTHCCTFWFLSCRSYSGEPGCRPSRRILSCRGWLLPGCSGWHHLYQELSYSVSCRCPGVVSVPWRSCLSKGHRVCWVEHLLLPGDSVSQEVTGSTKLVQLT